MPDTNLVRCYRHSRFRVLIYLTTVAPERFGGYVEVYEGVSLVTRAVLAAACAREAAISELELRAAAWCASATAAAAAAEIRTAQPQRSAVKPGSIGGHRAPPAREARSASLRFR